jgi:DNA-binding SARP family transcriptional activator
MPAAPGSHPTVALTGEVGLLGEDGQTVRPLRGRQPQLVLCHLLVEARPVERYELGELLWGERLPDHWAGAVRGVLSKVRAWLAATPELDGATLVADDGVVRLSLPASASTDLERARRALEEAQRALDERQFDEAATRAEQATSLLRSPFLPHGDGDWVTRQRDRFEGLVGTAARVHARALLGSGACEQAAGRALDRVGRDPLDEAAHHLLIQALLAADRRADAIRAFDELRDVLARELGIEPSPSTAALLDPDAATTATVDAAARSVGPRGPRTPEPFVGRRHELDALAATWTSTGDTGWPHLAVLRGHAGIGKTRLAEEVARRIPHGTQVLWGRCRAGSGLAFEPVAELLAGAQRTDPGLIGRLGPAAAALSPLLPDAPLTPPPAAHDPALERSRLFAAVTAAAAEIARTPTLAVVDDLQWASPDTVALLEILLERVTGPLLVLTTYRGRNTTVEAALARLQRTVPGTTLDLDGLREDDLRAVVEGFHPTPDAAQDRLVRDLHTRTGGNPFFIAEITGDARRRGVELDPNQLPDTARRWIEHRAAALDAPVAAVLDLGAVIGVEIDLDLLAACHPADGDTLARAYDTLLDEGLLVETDRPSHLAFPHAISHDAIYERLRAPRRLQLHRRIVETIEAQPRRPGRDALLAHHLERLGPEAAPAAAAHACAAGDDALARSAFALAADHFTTALALRPGDAGLHLHALLGLGRARYGDRELDAAREAFEEALGVARRHHRPLDLAEAALQLVGRAGRGAATEMTDTDRERLLREALAGLDLAGADDDDRRAALLGEVEGELALALLFADAADERTALVARSLTRARSADPVVPRHLARALLNRRIALLDPAQLSDRLADSAEVLALPPAELPPEQVIAALAYQHEDRLLTGDRAGAARSLTLLREAVDLRPHPYWTWVVHTWTALDHLIGGRLDQAEAAAFAAAEHQVGDEGESAACLGVNLISIRLWQGREVEVVDLVADAADRFPQVPCYRAVHALCASKAGLVDQAEGAYRWFADRRFAVPADTNRFLTLAVLADVATDLCDLDGGDRLSQLLTPYSGLQVVLNCYGGGGAYWGPADHQLARLARLAGRHDLADARFEAAATQADAFGAPAAGDRIRAELVATSP